jgi:hypothetical protein
MVNAMKPKPFLKKFPNPPSEATMDEDMVCRFQCLLAKRAGGLCVVSSAKKSSFLSEVVGP